MSQTGRVADSPRNVINFDEIALWPKALCPTVAIIQLEQYTMISGINHVTLSVRDTAQSFQFYTQVLGFRPVAYWPKGAYLLAGETWIALVLDLTTRTAILPEYTHIAFTVSAGEFESMSQRILQSGATIWQEKWAEG